MAKQNDKLIALSEENSTGPISPSSKGTNKNLHGGQNAVEHLETLKNFQNQILNKLAISGLPASQSIDLQRFLQAVVPLGFQPYEKSSSRNVALVISKAVDYKNVVDLFREDEQNEQVAKDSLLLLELITLLFENWANSQAN